MAKKRRVLRQAVFTLLFLVMGVSSAKGATLWETFLARFVSEDGRVVDYSQGKITHSEGQGYAMLLAVSYDDRDAFAKIWHWTENNIGVRKDGLFAWQWGRRKNGQWSVLDYNNATDGDILIAAALLKAGKKWKDPDYTASGARIVRAIREKLAFDWQGRTFLLPGYDGFEGDDSVTLNPSYVILPAFRLFAGTDDRAFWEKVIEDGRYLLGQSRFGKWGMPGEWVRLSSDKVLSHFGKNPYFGYGAVRVLLYLSFEKEPPYPAGLPALFSHYEQRGYIPLTVDLERDALSLTPASAGFYAIYALAAKKTGRTALSQKLAGEAEQLLAKEEKSYYSFVLYLLAGREDLFN